MSRLTPTPDVTRAGWIVAALQTFGESVLSLVPAGFDSYVRVFHPAWLCSGDERREVSWADIAAANGMQPNPGMQLEALTRSRPDARYEPQPGVYDERPEIGSLPKELIGPLAHVLERRTSKPERCWFAVWVGWADKRRDVGRAPTFELPAREYHLLQGAVSAVNESVGKRRCQRSPNLWWPDDHAWCVATEIDLDTTYIGCSDACRDEIVANPLLDASPIDPSAGIDWQSDPVNAYSEM